MLKFVKFADLPVSDQDRALSFYTEKLGLTVAEDSPYQDGWRWIELEIPGARTRIWFDRRANEEASEMPSLILVADDVGATYEELKASGVEFTQPPTAAPWKPGQTYALFRDSENNTILLGSS